MLREEPPWAKSVHILVSRSTPHVGSGAPMSACVSPPEFLARKSRNELLDLNCCFVRILFWEKVPAFHRLSAPIAARCPADRRLLRQKYQGDHPRPTGAAAWGIRFS
jgi:hypothetical protein